MVLKLALSDGDELLQEWILERDIGDMREKSSRRRLFRILFRELVEEIDHHNRWSAPLPEVKQADPAPAPTQDEMIVFLASLSPEERERILKA